MWAIVALLLLHIYFLIVTVRSILPQYHNTNFYFLIVTVRSIPQGARHYSATLSISTLLMSCSGISTVKRSCSIVSTVKCRVQCHTAHCSMPEGGLCVCHPLCNAAVASCFVECCTLSMAQCPYSWGRGGASVPHTAGGYPSLSETSSLLLLAAPRIKTNAAKKIYIWSDLIRSDFVTSLSICLPFDNLIYFFFWNTMPSALERLRDIYSAME